MSLSYDEYRKHDYRVKCCCCGAWMRWFPTEKTPNTRRDPPNALVCNMCLSLNPHGRDPLANYDLPSAGCKARCLNRGCRHPLELLAECG